MNALLEQINPAGLRFVEFALPMFVQSGVLILILLLTDFALRKKVRAVFRYWIWMLVLVKLILPTSLSTPVSLGYLFGDEIASVNINHLATETKIPEPAPAVVSPTIDLTNIQTDRFTNTPAPIIPATEPILTEPAQPPAESITPLSWQGAVFLAWLIVVMAMGLLLLQRAIFVRGLVAQAKEANNSMAEMLDSCRKRIRLKRKIYLKVSANATSPAVCGLFRPAILVPKNLASNLSSSQLRAVLLHELAHIKRGDLWVNLVQTFLQIVYFYNPLLWLANAIIRRIREQAVDEMVLVAMGAKARQYPQTLVSVAKLAFKRPALSLRLIGVVESKSALAGRIKHILNRPMPKRAKLGILGLMLIIITAAILLPMAKAERELRNPVRLDKNGRPFITHTLYMWQENEKLVWQLEGKTYRHIEQVVGRIKELMEEKIFPYIRVRVPEQFRSQQAPINKLGRLCRGIGFINMEYKYDLKQPPSPFRAMLPNGVTVELVGVCEYPSEGKQWWKPDGTELSKEIRVRTRGGVSASGIPYNVAVKVTMPEDATFELGRIKGAIGGISLEAVDSKGQLISNMRAFRVYIDQKLTETSIQLGAAAGPWKTRARDSSRGGKSTAGIVFSKAYESDGRVRIIVADEHLDLDYRIAAIDAQGKEHVFHQRGGSAGKVRQTTALFHDIKLNQIEYFLFQTRPYQWVEFKNVSLQPEHKTDVQVGVPIVEDVNPIPPRPELLSTPILGYDVKMNFADPTIRDGSFHNKQSVAFVMSFHSIEDLKPGVLLSGLLIGQKTFSLILKDNRITIQNGSTGREIDSESWSAEEVQFNNVITLPVKYGQKEYSCPIHVEIDRHDEGVLTGSYWFCAYLSGRLPWGAGGRSFEIVNLDQQMEFRLQGDGTDKRDAVLGIDIDGDGKINPADRGGEQFNLYEPFQIGSKTYRVTEVDPYLPRVVFNEIVPAQPLLPGHKTDVQVGKGEGTAEAIMSMILLGMEVADVTPDIQKRYELYHPYGVVILNPGYGHERLGIGKLTEGLYFWKVGNKEIHNLREMIAEILRINANARPQEGGSVGQGYEGVIRIVYGYRKGKGTNTQYLKPTKADIEELRRAGKALGIPDEKLYYGNQKEMEARIESAKKLSDFGKALFIYANDHDDKYPVNIEEVNTYLRNKGDLDWLIENIEYLGKGKSAIISPTSPLAYDETLLKKKNSQGTNVLYNDGRATFEKAEKLKELGIISKYKSDVQTEVKIEPADSKVSAEMVGTWFFDNPGGDDEQMAIFPDGRVLVLYSNGHRDETRIINGFIELAEYDGAKYKISVEEKGTLVQYFDSGGSVLVGKRWRRVDSQPRTSLLRSLTGPDSSKSDVQIEVGKNRVGLPTKPETKTASIQKEHRIKVVRGLVKGKGGQAIPKAKAVLYYNHSRWGLGNHVVEETESAADGSFSFNSPLAYSRADKYPYGWDSYIILATHPDYALGWCNITRGQEQPSYELILTMPQSQTIMVTDHAGNPLPGVRVWPYSLGSRESSDPLFRDYLSLSTDVGIVGGTTGPDGKAAITNLPRTRCSFHATLKGYATGLSFSGKKSIRLSKGAIVSGSVLDEEGKPVEGALVKFFTNWMWQFFLAETDSQGRFRFQDLPAEGWDMSPWGHSEGADGSYKITIEHDDYTAPETQDQLQPGEAIEKFIIDAYRGTLIKCQVMEVDTNRPIAGARISGSNESGRIDGYSDPNGLFTVRVMSGRTSLFFHSPPHGVYVLEGQNPPESHLRFDAQGDEMTVTLKSPPVGGPLTNVRGIVLGPDGKAQSDTVVYASAGRFNTATKISYVPPVGVNDDGQFELKEVPAGRKLCLYAATNDRTLAGTAIFEIPAAADRSPFAEIKLRATKKASIVIKDKAGNPVRNTALAVRPMVEGEKFWPAERTARTDERGLLEIGGILPGLEYHLRDTRWDRVSRLPREVVEKLFEATLTLIPIESNSTPQPISASNEQHEDFSATQSAKKTDVQVEVEPIVGDWQYIGQAIPPDFNDTMILTKHVNLGSIGQDAEGKTFITFIRDREKTRNLQYRFVLVKKGGNILEPDGYIVLGESKRIEEKFTFDEPFITRQLKGFRFQSRPLPPPGTDNISSQLQKAAPEEVKYEKISPSKLAPPGRYAIELDGIDDYLLVPDSPSLKLEPPFTVEMWVKTKLPADASEYRGGWAVISKGFYVGTPRAYVTGFGINLDRFPEEPSKLHIDFCKANNSGTYTSTYAGYPLTNGTSDWIHISHVFKGKYYKSTPGHPLVIGKFLIPTENPFKGLLGEVRLWNGARTRQELRQYKNVALTGTEPGLAACWTFEQTEGQFAYDISGNNNHARLGKSPDPDNADPTWVNVAGGSTLFKEPGNETDDQVLARSTVGPVGKYALSFDGVDDYLHVAANSTLTLKPPFTLEMWIKPDFSELPNEKASEKLWPFLSLLHKGKRLFSQETRIQAGGFMMFVGPSPQPDRNLKCSASLYLGNEKGLMYQVDGFYGDRLQPAQPGWLYVSMSCTRETYIPVPDQPLLIGQNIVPIGFPFKGQIAEIRIWAGVRSRDQVARYWNKPLNGNESGLVACWNFKRPGGQVVYDIGPNGNHARLGSSEGPDDADPKWIDIKATSDLPSQKTDVQVEIEQGNESSEPKNTEDYDKIPSDSVVIRVVDTKGRIIPIKDVPYTRIYYRDATTGNLVGWRIDLQIKKALSDGSLLVNHRDVLIRKFLGMNRETKRNDYTISMCFQLKEGPVFSATILYPQKATGILSFVVPPRTKVAGVGNVAPGELAGRVVDVDGNPIAGATISVYPDRGLENHPFKTDSKGAFRISGFGDRWCLYIKVEKDGYATQWLTDFEIGKNFIVTMDQSTVLRGVFVNDSGKQAGRTQITLAKNKLTMQPRRGNDVSHITITHETDDKGSYDFPVEPGLYDVKVASESGLFNRSRVFIGAGQTVSLPSTLKPGICFQVKVVDSLTNKPIKGVDLWIDSRTVGRVAMKEGSRKTTDSKGLAVWESLMPGNTRFTIMKKGYCRWWSDACLGGSRIFEPINNGAAYSWQRNIDSLGFDLIPDMPVVVIKMEEGVKLSGLVLSPDGKPVGKAAVDVTPAERPHTLTGDSRYRMITDANGLFGIKEKYWRGYVPAGKRVLYNLCAHDPEARWANAVSKPFASKPGDEFEFTLKMTKGGFVSGRVIDSESKPVPDIEVEAVAKDNLDTPYFKPRTLTDENGTFTLGPMREGKYSIQPDTMKGVNIARSPKQEKTEVKVVDGKVTSVGNLLFRTGGPNK